MRRPLVASVAAVALVVVIVLAWRATRGTPGLASAAGERTWPPLPHVVTVEVLNGGGSAGAARDAALRLRRAGLDVVSWGNAPESLRDSVTTQVRVFLRLGDSTGSGRVAEVLGSTEVRADLDDTRLVDLTVVIPRDTVR